MKELAWLFSGIALGATAKYLYRAKTLAEYAALKLWARGEMDALPAWFQRELAKGWSRNRALVKVMTEKL